MLKCLFPSFVQAPLKYWKAATGDAGMAGNTTTKLSSLVWIWTSPPHSYSYSCSYSLTLLLWNLYHTHMPKTRTATQPNLDLTDTAPLALQDSLSPYVSQAAFLTGEDKPASFTSVCHPIILHWKKYPQIPSTCPAGESCQAGCPTEIR